MPDPLRNGQREEDAATIRRLNEVLVELSAQQDEQRRRYMEHVEELVEARQLAGAGPWRASPTTLQETDRIIEAARKAYDKPVRESGTITAQGAYGDIELALQNVEWRRETTLSWMEFSRWGIQQIILITRLRYMKNPIMRRLIDVCAAYVFARGVEITTNDEAANDVLKRFFSGALGQKALTDLERSKDYDGNIFFVLFTDTESTGEVKCRTIDPLEILEIVTDPEDVNTPWLFKRQWSARKFDMDKGDVSTETKTAWYPALKYEPTAKPAQIGGHDVMWTQRVHHSKCGGISKWLYGCPRMYPANAYAHEAKKFLDNCASIKASLAQIAIKITTKGGQQAMAGMKQQFGTTVGPSSSLLDQNPPANAGSTFVSGPGTTLEAFNTRGAGADPEEVRQYKLMCCMPAGVPETFLGDVSTGNLATATSLDRPTETGFLDKQEAWREDCMIMATYVLSASSKAPSGRVREAFGGEGAEKRPILECRVKEVGIDGVRKYEAFADPKETLEIRVNFPAIREGDIPSLVSALIAAVTLGRAGEANGIDLKAAIRKLYDYLGFEDGDELTEQQFPEKTYQIDRTLEPEPEEEPADPNAPKGDQEEPDQKQREALRLEAALRRIGKALVERGLLTPNGGSH